MLSEKCSAPRYGVGTEQRKGLAVKNGVPGPGLYKVLSASHRWRHSIFDRGVAVRLRLATNVVSLCDCMYRSRRRLVHKSNRTRTTHPSQFLAQVHESRERRSTKMQNLRKRTLVACHQGLVRMTPRHAPHVDSYTGCTGSTLQE